MAAKRKRPAGAKSLNLALQGGGAHGAFEWGVLDAFLEDERIQFDGICATSAGSLNALAITYGLAIGGRGTAQASLENMWREISKAGALYSPIRKMPWDGFFKQGQIAEEAFSFAMFELFTNALSPYQFNPFNINPLRKILEKCFDLKKIQDCKHIKMFITATDVYSGKARVFGNDEITMDVILASACLPFLYQAVEIHGRPYWDGGYVGNPSLWPLFYYTDTLDLCVVHLNPLERHQLPKTAYEITNRVNEITFNTSLLAELRAIAFVNKLIEEDWLKPAQKKRLRHIRLHAIRADHELKNFSVASKFQTDWPFLTAMRDYGRTAAKHWIHDHYDTIGKKGTVDIKDEFLSKLDGSL